MYILFSNGEQVSIDLQPSLLTDTIKGIFKHLQHIEIPFRYHGKDNPYYLTEIRYEELVNNLVKFGRLVEVAVDRERCLHHDQDYFNLLHKIYEQKYDGNPQWLDYHEHIHLCEQKHLKPDMILSLDYREKAGPLEKTFDPIWLQNSRTKVFAGDVFLSWAELGKTPYSYWNNGEPNNVERLCELAKPWIKLRPKLLIALEDIDFLANKKIQEFQIWWDGYESEWCRRWGIESWTLKDMYSKSIIGRCADVVALQRLLKEKTIPSRVKLQ